MGMSRDSEALYRVDVHRDQIFSKAGGKPRLADIYLPRGIDGRIPVILWVHGGGWRFGDRNLAPDLSRFFAQRGFAMISFDYRLSDEVIFPDPVVDVKTAVRWIRSIAGQYALDPERLGLWGSSAGGHLSACAALSREDQFLSDEHRGFSSGVRAVVDGYGPTDFSRMDADRVEMPAKVTDEETRIVKPTVPTGDADSYESRLIGKAVSTSPVEVQLANPVTYVGKHPPPFLILHGQSDPLVPWQQSRLLYDTLADAGNEVTLVLLENLAHGFFNNNDLDTVDVGTVTIHRSSKNVSSPFEQESTQRGVACFPLVEDFFRKHLID
jgi:acetyl esterase/lipase